MKEKAVNGFVGRVKERKKKKTAERKRRKRVFLIEKHHSFLSSFQIKVSFSFLFPYLVERVERKEMRFLSLEKTDVHKSHRYSCVM